MKSKLPSILRDLFFGVMAVAIIVDQVFIAGAAQPILVFLAMFFLGCIPALRGDKKDGQISFLARFFMQLLGVPVPEDSKRKPDSDTKESSDHTHTRQD